jgi:hypothetical protein
LPNLPTKGPQLILQGDKDYNRIYLQEERSIELEGSSHEVCLLILGIAVFPIVRFSINVAWVEVIKYAPRTVQYAIIRTVMLIELLPVGLKAPNALNANAGA